MYTKHVLTMMMRMSVESECTTKGFPLGTNPDHVAQMRFAIYV